MGYIQVKLKQQCLWHIVDERKNHFNITTHSFLSWHEIKIQPL